MGHTHPELHSVHLGTGRVSITGITQHIYAPVDGTELVVSDHVVSIGVIRPESQAKAQISPNRIALDGATSGCCNTITSVTPCRIAVDRRALSCMDAICSVPE